MAALNEVTKEFSDEIRDGIAWVIIWKIGRSWHGYAAWLDPDTETFEPDDLEKVREVLSTDPNAVMLNGYYCGHFGEDMNMLELAAGIRWHYENGYNLLSDSTAIPDNQETEPQEVVKAVQPAIDYAVKKAREFIDWAIQAAGEFAKNAAESLSKFMDAMLYSVNTHPKWWHLYKHAKKYRVRKKYRKRLMQQLIESLRAAPDPLEVIT